MRAASRILCVSTTVLSCLPLLAQHEQTPIDIRASQIVRDTNPPIITFNNYSFADLKVENTYGATERFYTVTGNPAAPGDLKTIAINKEWGTLKATPCADSAMTRCANYATPLPNGPSVSTDGKQYALQQFHFHAPAEHTVAGVRPAMEVHFVHLLNNGCAADDHRPGLVVGAFIVEGTPDSEMNRFFQTMDELPRKSSDAARYVRANLRALLPADAYRWRYEGGLTAPAGSSLCGGTIPDSVPGGGTVAEQLISGVFPEVVHWFLYETTLRMSREQIVRFKELFPEGNARAIKENESKIYESPAPTPPATINAPPVAVANPKSLTAIARSIQLDGSQSTSSDGRALNYSWTVPAGAPAASIVGPGTAMPSVQFQQGPGTYRFQLTVTDSTGRTATDIAVVNFVGI